MKESPSIREIIELSLAAVVGITSGVAATRACKRELSVISRKFCEQYDIDLDDVEDGI